MHKWTHDIVTWKMLGKTYISVAFTWHINKAIKVANETKGRVFIGGPGAVLMKSYLLERVESHVNFGDGVSGIEPVTIHNPFATFTSRGCVSKCRWCAVPIIEGEFREIPDFIPRPLVYDNNFLACSEKHLNKAIDKLKLMPSVDFNQSLDALLFTPERATKLQALKIPVLRFSLDTIKKETQVVDAIRLAKKRGFKNLNICVLYGFNQTVDEAVYIGELLRKEKVSIFPMRFQPLDALTRNAYVDKKSGWTDNLLRAYQRCFHRTNVPFSEFNNNPKYICIGNDGFFDL